MKGTEHNAVPSSQLTVGGEIFLQYIYLCTWSFEPKDRVLHGDMTMLYWSNFFEAYDDFENQVEECSGYNYTCNQVFDYYCLGNFGSMTQLVRLQSFTRMEILDKFVGARH